MEKNLTADDKFLANMRKKHNTKEKDVIEKKKITMEGILEGVVQVPEKLHMISSPDRSSVKEKKSGENQLHTGEGKDMFKSTM
jgi:hypothetical protein